MNQSIPTINHYVALVKVKDFNESLTFAEEIADSLIKDLRLNIVKKTFHLFRPKGVTLAFILSESHLVIHTWPELNYLHIDLVTCSYRGMDEFAVAVRSSFSKGNIDRVEIKSVNFDKRENPS